MSDNDAHIPSSPRLVAPRDAAAVDGSEVTFVWEPVEEAEAYRLQIAPTARFENPVLDADVGSETAVTVGNQLPTDGQTFFWRVRAGSDAGWSTGGAVESFLATTAAEADPVDGGGEIDEAPVTELARAARREATTESFDLEKQFEKEKERGVAYEGVASSEIVGFAVAVVAAILLAVTVLISWFGQVRQEARTSAITVQTYHQIREAELQASEHLEEYGVIDGPEGIYHIPIDQAMDVIATEEYQQQQEQQSPSP